MNDVLLQVQGLSKSYNANTILRDVDLTVCRGQVIALIGPSGGGKSTLLRCMNFLETPDSGEITFNGEAFCYESPGGLRLAPNRSLRNVRAKMPMVFQNFNLFAHRTALQNVMEGPRYVLHRPKGEVEAEAREILGQVGLGDRADHYPDQLSGGQKQRVAIARALAMRPEMILFDEPTSALDPELVSGVLDTIKSLADRGLTLIIVTHEMTFARKIADEIHFMADGKIVESGDARRIFESPQEPRLVEFIRSILSH